VAQEPPQSVAVTTWIVLELLKGRRLGFRDVMDEHGLSYQQARRYLLGLTELLPLEAERDGKRKVFRLRPRSLPANPDVVELDTGQLPLFDTGEGTDDESEGD
jgi:hypothetical protein